jgi:hypothetical protein
MMYYGYAIIKEGEFQSRNGLNFLLISWHLQYAAVGKMAVYSVVDALFWSNDDVVYLIPCFRELPK